MKGRQSSRSRNSPDETRMVEYDKNQDRSPMINLQN